MDLGLVFRDFAVMPRIRDKEIRDRLSRNFRMLRNVDGFGKTCLCDMDTLLAVARMSKEDARKDALRHLQPQFSAAYAHLTTLSAFCLGLILDDETPLPKDWLGDCRRDPAHILRSNLLQLVNHGSSVLRLLECGLTNSARSLLRTLIETTWTTVIFCGAKDKAQQYAQGIEPESARAIWHRHFSPRASLNSLGIIEQSLGLPIDLTKQLEMHRKDIYKIHTQSLHNTCSFLEILSFDSDLNEKINDEQICYPTIFGRVGIATKSTFEDVNDVLGYAVLMMFLIFRVLHSYVSRKSDSFWHRGQSFAIGSLGIWFGAIGFEPVGRLWAAELGGEE